MNLWGTWVTYEVEGLVSCPPNSHVQFEFLIPIHLVKKYFFSSTAFTSWKIRTVYTYLLMREGFTDSDKIRTEFQDFLYRHGGEELKEKISLNIEPLEEIYLKSELAFDFQPRGNAQHIQILTLVAIGILLMAIINFINISSAQSLRRLKEISIKKILGSGNP